MTYLLRAELIRLWHRRLYLLALALAVLPALIPLLYLLLRPLGPNYDAYARGYASFPTGVFNLLRGGQTIVPLAITFLAGAAVGEDYGTGCLKVMLPRVDARWRVVVAKVLAIAVAGLVLRLVMLVVLFGGSALCRAVLDVEAEAALGLDQARDLLGFFLLETLYLAALSTFLGTLGRSQPVAIILAILGPHLMRALALMPGGGVTPGVRLDAVSTLLLPRPQWSAEEVAVATGGELVLGSSIAIVLVSCAVLMAAAAVLLERRDAG